MFSVRTESTNKEIESDRALPSDSIADNQEILKEKFPEKILFSIEETAAILNLSYEFVRMNILQGRINAKRYGRRYLIHLIELSRILTNGV